jgi:hypothetical protein
MFGYPPSPTTAASNTGVVRMPVERLDFEIRMLAQEGKYETDEKLHDLVRRYYVCHRPCKSQMFYSKDPNDRPAGTWSCGQCAFKTRVLDLDKMSMVAMRQHFYVEREFKMDEEVYKLELDQKKGFHFMRLMRRDEFGLSNKKLLEETRQIFRQQYLP